MTARASPQLRVKMIRVHPVPFLPPLTMSYWNNSDDFAPESSPDSSPLLCASSSPPSSPGLDALELDDHVPIDPLAGAYKRQKRGGMDSERSRSPKRARHEAGTEEEDKIWEEAGTNAFERNQRVFNLM